MLPPKILRIDSGFLYPAGRKYAAVSRPDGSPSSEFRWFIGGLQRYAPAATALFAPYVNSYRRLARFTAAPINLEWGGDNRTVSIRSLIAETARRSWLTNTTVSPRSAFNP